MDIETLKGMVVEQLKAKVGLDEAKAKQAADVVANLVQEHGPKLVAGLTDKLGDKLPAGVGDALGGFLGKK
ncbi:MAG: hypothetical protein H6720_20745 [Sandaracinus sp.]|nr:hypothetical protein [Sandaracinus sp.]